MATDIIHDLFPIKLNSTSLFWWDYKFAENCAAQRFHEHPNIPINKNGAYPISAISYIPVLKYPVCDFYITLLRWFSKKVILIFLYITGSLTGKEDITNDQEA